MDTEYLIRLLLMIPVSLLSLSVHESAHGYVSYKLGDPTARNLGRITLNPLKHFDPIGALCMLFFRVGWAKPVPVNARYYKNPRKGMALTAAAGPLSNLLLAVIGVLCGELTNLVAFKLQFTGAAYNVGYIIWLFFYLLAWSNISLAIFNLLPVPPFDGSRILYVFLPPKYYFGIMKYERIIMIVVLALFVFDFFDAPLAFLTEGVYNGIVWLVELIPIFK
ncbi:MAG: site-2 protease family protein [Clostridia bacterium]|nr:site-2 protease family protein [Clostridia bacterium]